MILGGGGGVEMDGAFNIQYCNIFQETVHIKLLVNFRR